MLRLVWSGEFSAQLSPPAIWSAPPCDQFSCTIRSQLSVYLHRGGSFISSLGTDGGGLYEASISRGFETARLWEPPAHEELSVSAISLFSDWAGPGTMTFELRSTLNNTIQFLPPGGATCAAVTPPVGVSSACVQSALLRVTYGYIPCGYSVYPDDLVSPINVLALTGERSPSPGGLL